jgi:hypothetical protein
LQRGYGEDLLCSPAFRKVGPCLLHDIECHGSPWKPRPQQGSIHHTCSGRQAVWSQAPGS